MLCDKLTIILCFLLLGIHAYQQLSQKCFGQTCQVKQQRKQENSRCSQPIIISNSVIQLGRCSRYLFTLPLLNSAQHKNELMGKVLRNLIQYRSKNRQNHGFDVLSRVQSQIRRQFTQLLAINIQDKHSVKLKLDLKQAYPKSEQNQILFFSRNENTQSILYQPQVAALNLDFKELLAKNNIVIHFNSKQGTQSSNQPSFAIYLSKNYEEPSFLYLDISQTPSLSIVNSVAIKLKNKNSYQLRITCFNINEVSLLGSKSVIPNVAIVSSATQYLTMSQKLYDFLITNYFTSCSKLQVSNCTCNNLDFWPKFKLQFGSLNINIHPQTYLNVLPNGLCTFNFHVNQNLDDNVIEIESSLFYSLTQNNQVNQEGDTVNLILIDFTFFEVSMYFLLVTIALFTILSGVMLWKYRVVKPEKYPSRFYEISLSSRFLDNS